MKRKFVLLFAAVAIGSMLYMLGCTDNTRAKVFGGNITKKLKPGEKFVNVTWKENQLWILTRPMRADETAETFTFQEDSNFGVMEGSVTIVESK